MKKTFTRTINIVLIIFIVLLLIYNTFNLIGKLVYKQDMPSFLGFSAAVVLTGSMTDVINPGDMIIIKQQNEYKINDIITYNQDGDYITHRLIQTEEEFYITKGDANDTADKQITKDQIEGKVVAIIPKIGFVTDFFKKPEGLLVIILLIAFYALFKKTAYKEK